MTPVNIRNREATVKPLCNSKYGIAQIKPRRKITNDTGKNIFIGLTSIIKKNWGRLELTALVFVMTILWDLITATFFAIQFFIPWQIAIVNQIPFTILHLSNCIIAFLFAPYLMRAFLRAREFSMIRFLKRVFVYT